MSEPPLTQIPAPTGNSRFGVEGAGFVKWLGAIASTMNVLAVEIQNRAAAAAANLYISKTDPRIPVQAPDQAGWAHLDIDGLGNVISGIRVDGSRYFNNMDSPTVLSVKDERIPQPGPSFPTWQHVDVDGEGNIISGRKMDGTRYFRSLETPALEGIPQTIRDEVAANLLGTGFDGGGPGELYVQSQIIDGGSV